jgi:hypothetical protein
MGIGLSLIYAGLSEWSIPLSRVFLGVVVCVIGVGVFGPNIHGQKGRP